MSAAVCLLASLLSCDYSYTEARLQPPDEYTQSIKRERLALKRERLGLPRPYTTSFRSTNNSAQPIRNSNAIYFLEGG